MMRREPLVGERLGDRRGPTGGGTSDEKRLGAELAMRVPAVGTTPTPKTISVAVANSNCMRYQSLSAGDRFVYATPTRGSAMNGATVSLHVA